MPLTDYRPGLVVDVVGRLPAPITVQLLRLPGGDTVPVLRRPDEYTGYVVRATVGGDQVVADLIVFTREMLAPEGRYLFRGDATVFDEQLRLIRTTARVTAGRGDDTESPLPITR